MQAPSFLTALGRAAPSHETETCNSRAILIQLFIFHTDNHRYGCLDVSAFRVLLIIIKISYEGLQRLPIMWR